MTLQDSDIDRDKPRAGASWYFAITAFVGLVTAFVFVGVPQLDIEIARLFFLSNGGFVFNFPGFGQTLRAAFQVLFGAALLLALAGLMISIAMRRNLLTLTFPKWLYLVLCLAIGPGIVANVILKDNWGRARPFHIQEFNGEQTFTPVLMVSDQCAHNCSFVAGEAAAMYMLFFAAAFLAVRRRNALLLTGIVAGLAAGGVRMAQGGHFMSDVIFAGVFMALVAEGLLWLIFSRGRETFADDGPLHRWLAALPRKLRTGLRGLPQALAALREGRASPSAEETPEPRRRRWPLSSQSE